MKKPSGPSGPPIREPGDQPSGTPDGPLELPARRGFSVFYQGKTLLSRVDPAGQAERLAAGITVKERTLYFCPSPLYGYGLSVLLGKLPENSAILCAEADGKLSGLPRGALGEFAPRRIALVKLTSPGALCAFVRKTWGLRRFRRVEEIRLTGGWQLFPRLYSDSVAALRRELAVEWGNAMTLIRLGRLYAKNLIRNLAFLPCGESIAALDFGASPVLVLGAGPSLDTVLDETAALHGGEIPEPGKRRYKIICVDTCLPALHGRGILPDLVVVLESQHWNLRDFAGAQGRTIGMAADLSALPASTRVLGGERFFFATPWTELALFGRLEEAGILPETCVPLGSVGLCAVALALARGSGPVFTGGIDFSFSLDAYHARSTPGHIALEMQQTRFRGLINARAAFRDGTFTAVSKNGTQVRSDPAMRNYRVLFEQEFGGNARLSDIAGPGLPLGVKTVQPAEAFAVLNGERQTAPPRPRAPGMPGSVRKEQTAAFIRREKDTLALLKEILTGGRPAGTGELERLLDYADYLWAHFPECAGTGGPETENRRPPCTDLGFLKRVRAEIDKFAGYWEEALGGLA